MTLNRILLIRTGALGDLIVTLPVLSALKAAAPRACLHLLGYPRTLVMAQGYADSIASIDQADWAPTFVQNGRLPRSCVDRINTADLVLSYLPDPDGIFTANLRRAGARTVHSFHPHPPPDGSIHIVDHLLSPLSTLHIPAADPVPRVLLTREDRQSAEQILHHQNLADTSPAVIHPGSGGAAKRWPPERFAPVADRIARIQRRDDQHGRCDVAHRIVAVIGVEAEGEIFWPAANPSATKSPVLRVKALIVLLTASVV